MRKAGSGILSIIMFVVVLMNPLAVSAAEANFSLSAASAIVIDYETGETLYSKDADSARVPASMTKIMTAYIIFEEIEKGNLSLDTMIKVSPEAASMSNNSNYPMAVPLVAGDSYSVDTLLKLIMIPSASASCFTMAEHISGSEAEFVKRMNETAKALGMTADYKNCHGAMAHYTTARSTATLIRCFIQKYPDILNYTSLKSVEFRGKTYNNTNGLLLSTYHYDGADGFKTGTIAEAGYCLSATAARDGRRIISVIMKSANNETRHTDSIKVLDYGFQEQAKRDAARSSVEFAITAPNEIRANSDFYIYAQPVSGETDFAFSGEWQVEGQTVKTYDYTLITDSNRPSLTHYINKTEKESINIKLTMNMLDGSKKEWEANIPVSNVEPAMYRDIDKHWAEDSIVNLSNEGIFSGYPDGYFRPGEEMNFGMLLTVLGRFAEESGVANINQSNDSNEAYYEKYMEWAKQNNLIGDSFSNMKPSDNVDRKTFSAVIYNFAVNYDIELNAVSQGKAFSDEQTFPEWAVIPIQALSSSEILSGFDDGSFRPDSILTRAELCVIIDKLADKAKIIDESYNSENAA